MPSHITIIQLPSELAARASTVCFCCEEPKEEGLAVCWTCFKYKTPSGIGPYKYSHYDFETWLAHARKGGVK